MRNSKVDLQNMNIVIVTHGLAIRLFLMRWFQYSVDDFEETYNPTNGSLNIMERHENEHGEQWFEIENEVHTIREGQLILIKKNLKHKITAIGNQPAIRLAVSRSDVDHIYD